MNMEAKFQKRRKMDTSSAKELNFGFGFNDVDFSDRVLRLEIIQSENTAESSSSSAITWHINSLLLAAKSQFFHKLFKNGMRESQQNAEVTITINASEEEAVRDMLKSMYDKPLNATSASDLVDVLVAADKFEVPSCAIDCVDKLLKLPMSIESALLYCGLPSSVLEGELVQPLTCATKSYLASKDFTKSDEEMMELPLFLMEILLGNDHLQVDSEEVVFEFILKWARARYPKLEERREILTNRLARFICFQHMNSSKLKEVVDCPDFDREQVSKLVLNALLMSKDEAIATQNDCPRRTYKNHGLKVVQLEYAQPRCIVYFEVKKRECAELLPSEQVCSRTFCLGGHVFNLYVQRIGDLCDVIVQMKIAGEEEALTFDCEMAVVKKPTKTFKVLCETRKWIPGGVRVFRLHERRLWARFMSDESEYFIDGILCVRADITLLT